MTSRNLGEQLKQQRGESFVFSNIKKKNILKADLQQSVDTITAVRSIVLRTIDRARIRDQKVSALEQNCILLLRAHVLIVRAQIENNRSYVCIALTLYWRSASTMLSVFFASNLPIRTGNFGEKNRNVSKYLNFHLSPLFNNLISRY